ncbi:AraC family transcriptional regulator [uncultured Cohaesibacter sp.]|uniref:AraC family transcriptional regulator n=1 Tax=uncultured Cohaesibacter sp. TaxID=1002546 RepID=UPI0029C8599C|nr:AraC family transcriptional regulator [uncultured Cohaesibacter sp.]
MIEKIEHSILDGIPASSLHLNLSRSTIKMRHSESWSVYKSNEVHDLIVCLRGGARYRVDDVEVKVRPGSAMLIPAGAKFEGQVDFGEQYTGVAQHFTLSLFDNVDLIQQMELKPVATLQNWEQMEPLIRYYREVAPASATTLRQTHLFMVILMAFLDVAFLRWREDSLQNLGGQDALGLHVMLIAAQISRYPLEKDQAELLIESVPYNADYFRRAFKTKLGYTPKKYMEFKRMEKAMNILLSGESVKATALKMGYSDVYFFSRMFKQYIGVSPSHYRVSAERKKFLTTGEIFQYHE